MKISVAVLFGGKSVEHEVSVISAVQAMANLDETKYEIIPVYITKSDEMWSGEALRDIENYKDIPALLRRCQPVGFHVRGDKTYLDTEVSGLFSKRTSRAIDLGFPIAHGTHVEDGALQGFLDTVNLPYVGSDVLASAVGMDKFVQKTLLRQGGFPVLPGSRFSTADWSSGTIAQSVEADYSYPVMVKPVNLGSSVGIGRANTPDELRSCLDLAFSFASQVVVEPAVSNLREINCAVLGDADAAEASECEEPTAVHAMLTYEDKYGGAGRPAGAKSEGSKSDGSKNPASPGRRIPADITPEQRQQIRGLAVDAFRYLRLCGVTRIDFLMDAATGEIWLNEVNTIPGSLAFYLWAPLGVSYPELLDRLIGLALKRQRQTEDLTYAFDTNILANSAAGTKATKASQT